MKSEDPAVSLFGRAYEAYQALSSAVYTLGGTDKQIWAAFLSDSVRLNAMAAIIVYGVAAATPATAETAVPAGHYRVHVNYVLPDFRQLNGTLFNWASNLWDGREWKKHPKCPQDLDLTPRELTFFLKHFGKGMTDAQVMEWAEKNGYRVANHLEALAFAMANPELQKQFYYVALGSFAVDVDGYGCVACLGSSGAERGLYDSYLLDDAWLGRTRFLLVRK